MMGRSILRAAAAIVVAGALLGGGAATAATLDTVKARGHVQCGVNTGLAGFSMPDKEGHWKGLDVDLCRAVAAAVFGDAEKAKYTPLTAQQRFTALQSGEIDVLLRNSTITITRDSAIGLGNTGVNFYDGQAFMVRRDPKLTSFKQLGGATICVAQGTTHEANMADTFRANNIAFKPIVYENQDRMYDAFFAGGRCDAMTQDFSALAAALTSQVSNPGDYAILPERISKEPLGPFVRHGDDQWFDIVKYVFMAMIEAEEKGVTQANVDATAETGGPEVKRFLGVGQGYGQGLGLDDKFAYNIIKQIGNYGESFERNVGKGSPLKLERGLNDLWNRGGLMYAIPFR
jgi:general L-amino acid transport system substrate-binding protein